jgi:hypothetical protein
MASLLNTSGLGRRTFPELGRGQLKARMGELCEGQWTSPAVRQAIQSILAGVAKADAAANQPAA